LNPCSLSELSFQDKLIWFVATAFARRFPGATTDGILPFSCPFMIPSFTALALPKLTKNALAVELVNIAKITHPRNIYLIQLFLQTSSRVLPLQELSCHPLLLSNRVQGAGV